MAVFHVSPTRRRTVVVGLVPVLVSAVFVMASSTIAPAAVPTVSLPNRVVSIVEGDSGSAAVALTVSLTPASTSTVTVNYTTADGSAKAADSDYVPTNGTITFAPGITTQLITVSIIGDALLEDFQLFAVKLSAPTNAKLGRSSEQVQILNDEKPVLSMANATKVVEGQPAMFRPKLNARYYQPITLSTTTSDGSAVAPDDYVAVDGSITFNAGTRGPLAFDVATNSDGIAERTETFTVTAAGPDVVAGLTRTATIQSQLCRGATPPSRYEHVVIVTMENKTYSSVFGGTSAPWLTA